MAGHYFYDPRPYYGLNQSSNLMPLDELFYKYEPVPYWMDQRMAPMSYPDYHPGHVKQVMTRGPEVQQFLPYNSPELAVRDDIYSDIYKRSPHFNNFASYSQPRGLSQDDTWVHTMAPQYANPQNQFPHQGMLPYRGYGAVADMPMPMQMGHLGNNGSQQHIKQAEVPMHRHMSSQKMSNANYNGGEQYGQIEVTNRGSKNHGSSNGSGTKSTNKQMYNNDESCGNVKSSKQMYGNDDTYGNKSKKEMYNNDDGFGSKTSKKMYNNDDSYSNKSNGNMSYGVSTKQGNAKQQQRYTNDDSSSDDDEDEYGNNKSGGKWGTKPLLKHSKSDTYSHGKKFDNELGSKKTGKGTEYQSYGSNNMVQYDSGKKQSGHKNGSQSKSSKMSYQNGGEGSSDEDESYAYTKKASKAGQHNQGITKVQHSQGHDGREQSTRGFDSHVQNDVQQPKHTQFHSQSKSVELKVPICCDNCERKVKACLEYIDGVESILCDQWQKKVIVYGNVKPDVVLKRVKKVKRASELWQQAKRIPVY